MAGAPISELRDFIERELRTELPDGVFPVSSWCAEPQFFPGASGLMIEDDWEEVRPGSRGLGAAIPPAPIGGVLVLGNYQATLSSYERIVSGEIAVFPTTWRVLRQLLAQISPREVFLTNCYVGLPDLDRDTAPFPITPSFRSRCVDLFCLEIELLQPRCVVCLGVPAAKFLASIATGLDPWQRWTDYRRLDETNNRVVVNCGLRRRLVHGYCSPTSFRQDFQGGTATQR